MSLLCDMIEEFIKSMFDEYEDSVNLQRNELAAHFNCAPSQINYVLATRFNLDRGYIIESKKGGGGYIRVIRIDVEENDILDIVQKRITGEISEKDAVNIIEGLKCMELITKREERILKAAVYDKSLNVPVKVRDGARAAILKTMLISLLKGS